MKIEIKVGQIWKENDPRFNYYKKVIDVSIAEVLLERCDADGARVKGSVQRWSKLERFDGRRGGFTLHKQVP